MTRTGCSPPGTGGVAALVRKRREASEAAQTGWSLTRNVADCQCETLSVSDYPVRAFSERELLLMARPPLLCKEGNALSLPFVTVITKCSTKLPSALHRRAPHDEEATRLAFTGVKR